MKKTFLFVILMLALAAGFAQTPSPTTSIIYSNDDDPPVEISKFSANITPESLIQLTWVSQHETGMWGYRVYRGECADQSSALLLTPTLIPATNTNTEQVYNLEDSEAEHFVTYWYWLEAVEMTGIGHFYGPISIGFLGVEITNFSASITAQFYVKLSWTSIFECNLLGYNIYRNNSMDLGTAIQVSPLIAANNTTQTQTYVYEDRSLETSGTYWYWLQVVSLYGESCFLIPTIVEFITDNDSDCIATPFVTNLEGAYPNPFNPTTNIRYQLDGRGKAKIDIYNQRGQLVRSFSRYHDAAGSYDILWDGRDSSGGALASGVYLSKMSSGSYKCAKKLVLQK